MEDFLTESDIYNLPASTSSIHWHGTHEIDYENKQLILKVVKNDKLKQYFDVRIDLNSGKVLDEVVDRLPSLQFLFSTKDLENYAEMPSNSVTDTCEVQENITQLSSSEFYKKIIQKDLPKYPVVARAVRATGASVFEVVISKEGNVLCINHLSGHPLVKATLINSIENWKFDSFQTNYSGKIMIEGKSVLTLNGKEIE